jgi:predicted SAM-dependent methyltransferase
MKINLMHGSGTILSGFINIDDTQNNKMRVDNLDKICEDSECDEIIAEDVIDYFSSKEVDLIIQGWVSKLRHGGKIVIGGIDLDEICKSLYNKRINLVEANILIFGNQKHPWEFRKSGLTSILLVKVLKNYGLNIIKKRINLINYHYVIEAERP